ncbi:MAG: threonine synthase, partial [Christensenellaceae bacterium]|nr:threonine synthase [Christensenellaceae bacterium]
NVVVSTASPYKFVSDVLYAVTGERVEEPFTAAKMLSEKTGTALPKQISALETAEIIHKNTSEKEKLAEAVLGFI